jgi:hypothetical protein
MVSPDPTEMERMQILSDKYRPELEVGCFQASIVLPLSIRKGPLVGGRLPMTDLVTEYAQADPTYVAKTHVSSATPLGGHDVY